MNPPPGLAGLYHAFQEGRLAQWQHALDTYRILSSETSRFSELVPSFEGLHGVSDLVCKYVGYAADRQGEEDTKEEKGKKAVMEATEFQCCLPMQLTSVPWIGRLCKHLAADRIRRVWRRQLALQAPAAQAGLFLSLLPRGLLQSFLQLNGKTPRGTVLATRNIASESGKIKVQFSWAGSQWSLVAYTARDPTCGLVSEDVLGQLRAAAARCGLKLVRREQNGGMSSMGENEQDVQVYIARRLRGARKRKRSGLLLLSS